MLRKIRIALVVTIMAVAASADSASALGFYRGGDFGYFGFGGVL